MVDQSAPGCVFILRRLCAYDGQGMRQNIQYFASTFILQSGLRIKTQMLS